MPAGGFSVSSAPPAGREFEAKITPIVIISCILAATGGLMFGYDVGVSGGVTSMNDFLEKFFPKVYRKKNDTGLDSNYCKYDNQGLQLFTSSLYLAGLTATFFASYTTRRLGRRLTMLIAGFFFIGGVIFNGTAQDLAMLIVGRILLGCGVGFANQVFATLLSSFCRYLNDSEASRIDRCKAAKTGHHLHLTVSLSHIWVSEAPALGRGARLQIQNPPEVMERICASIGRMP